MLGCHATMSSPAIDRGRPTTGDKGKVAPLRRVRPRRLEGGSNHCDGTLDGAISSRSYVCMQMRRPQRARSLRVPTEGSVQVVEAVTPTWTRYDSPGAILVAPARPPGSSTLHPSSFVASSPCSTPCDNVALYACQDGLEAWRRLPTWIEARNWQLGVSTPKAMQPRRSIANGH